MSNADGQLLKKIEAMSVIKYLLNQKVTKILISSEMIKMQYKCFEYCIFLM